MTTSALAPLFWLMCGGFVAAALGHSRRRLAGRGRDSGRKRCRRRGCPVARTPGPVRGGQPLGRPANRARRGSGLTFHLDRFGAVFLAVIGGVTMPVAVYGFGYAAAYDGRYSMRWMALQTGVFLLSMSLVCAREACSPSCWPGS